MSSSQTLSKISKYLSHAFKPMSKISKYLSYAFKPMSSSQPPSTISVLTFLVVYTLIISPLVVLAIHSTTDDARGCSIPSFTPNFSTDPAIADLKVLVPNITSLRQFVDCSNATRVRGFCIDVFERALSILLPPALSHMSIHYTCFNFSSAPNASGPTYDDMVDFVANGTYDVVVGDVTIAAHRLSKVEFTNYYMESGVVILTKVAPQQLSQWLLFGSPFSFRMWFTIVGAFAVTGLLICFLDFDRHPEFTRGHIGHRIEKILWFMIEALLLLEKESVKSTVARLVMVVWVFFVLLLSASYTAGLSSFLTASSLSSPSQDIISLRESGKPLGYRRGSIVKDYLVIRFHIPEPQLKAIRTLSDFVGNITRGPEEGGVIAIVDELPYINMLLSNLSSSTCDFAITGPQLTSEGFGFGFNKERNLTAAFSVAVMNLTESGCLQEIQDSYNLSKPSACFTSDTYSTQVTWRSSMALFIPFVVALVLCISVHIVRKYVRLRHTVPIKKLTVIEDHSTHYMFGDLAHRHQHGGVELHEYPH